MPRNTIEFSHSRRSSATASSIFFQRRATAEIAAEKALREKEQQQALAAPGNEPVVEIKPATTLLIAEVIGARAVVRPWFTQQHPRDHDAEEAGVLELAGIRRLPAVDHQDARGVRRDGEGDGIVAVFLRQRLRQVPPQAAILSRRGMHQFVLRPADQRGDEQVGEVEVVKRLRAEAQRGPAGPAAAARRHPRRQEGDGEGLLAADEEGIVGVGEQLAPAEFAQAAEEVLVGFGAVEFRRIVDAGAEHLRAHQLAVLHVGEVGVVAQRWPLAQFASDVHAWRQLEAHLALQVADLAGQFGVPLAAVGLAPAGTLSAGTDPALGVMWGLGAATFYGLYLIITRRIATGSDAVGPFGLLRDASRQARSMSLRTSISAAVMSA